MFGGRLFFPTDSETDFKVACLFVCFLCQQFQTILFEASFDSCSLSYIFLDCWERKKMELLLILYFFCSFAQVGMALILLSSLLSCIGTKCTDLFCKIYIVDASDLRVHIQAERKNQKYKKFSKSFLFFFNLRNNILHEYKYNGRFLACTKMCSNLERKTECMMSAVSVYISIY